MSTGRAPAASRRPRAARCTRATTSSSDAQRPARGRCRRRTPAARRRPAPRPPSGGSARAVAGQSRPIAALRGVHRVGDAEPARPEVAPERQRGVPVEDGRAHRGCCRPAGRRRRAPRRRRSARTVGAAGTGHRTGSRSTCSRSSTPPPGSGTGRRRPYRPRSQVQLRHLDAAALGGRPQAELGELDAAGAGEEVVRERRRRRRSRVATWRRNASHCTLKPLSSSALSGTTCHWSRKRSVTGRSGFQTGIGVAARCWIRHSRRPATALPWVPSTWNSTSSSRFTRTHHEELTCATTPPSSSKIAYAASSAVAS